MRLLKFGLVAGALALSSGAAFADYSLTILHTNDFHSRFEPISKYDSTCSEKRNQKGKCFGGSARLATAIAKARRESNNTILVDGGDQFQGSLFYTYYKGKLAAEMMNRFGYDAMTVGNHEFDDGPEVLRGFIDSVKFPVLMSNADISKEPILSGKIKKSVVLERGGQKLGFIGLTPQDTAELASPGKNVKFIDPVAAVRAEVEKLTKQGINKIIVLSHSGYGVDKKVAAQVKGIDVIVGGHTNTLLSNVLKRAKGPYPTMVGSTAIVQAYAYGKFLGKLDVVFDDQGNIKSATGEPLIMNAKVAEDEKVKMRIKAAGVPLDKVRKKVVAEAAEAIEGNRKVCRVRECQMGNLVADALLDRVKSQGVTIAITNAGGLRASIDKGDITMGEVLTVLPFQNTLSTFQVTGATIVAALENGVSQVEDVKGRFPQVAGLKYTWDPSVAPLKGRIKQVLVRDGDKWVPIEATKLYLVVSNNYVRNGGDGYKMFRTAQKPYDYGPDVADVVAEYLARAKGYRPYLDGRITKAK